MHRKLAERVSKSLPLTIREVPFDIPPIRQAVQWHMTGKNDFAIQWVIGQLRTVALERFGDGHKTTDATEAGRIAVEFQATRESR